MPSPFATVDQALAQLAKAAKLKFEVRYDDGTWVDLNTLGTVRDRLVRLGGLTARQERGEGTVDAQISSLVLRNDDRFFSKPPPTGLKTWKDRLLRITVLTAGGNEILGVWVIRKIPVKKSSQQATMQIVTMLSLLMDKKADRVRNGRDWWAGKPIGFNIRRLLEVQHPPATVAAWTGIQKKYEIPLFDPTQRRLSSLMRPPEIDNETPRTPYGSPFAVVNDAASAYYGLMWCAVDDKLYRYEHATETFTLWGKIPAADAGKKIHHVFLNLSANRVVVVAWEPQFPTTNVSPSRGGSVNGVVRFYWAPLANLVGDLTQFTGGPAEVFTGHFFVRAGRYDGTNTIIGAPGSAQLDANSAGINMPLPFLHWMRLRNSAVGGSPPWPDGAMDLFKKAAHNTKPHAGDDANRYARTSPDYWGNDLAGYYAYQNSAPGTQVPLDFRWSLGQRGAFAHQNAGVELAFTVVTWDGAIARYKCQIYKLNTSTGTYIATGYYVMTGGEYYQPTSLEFRSDDLRLLVTATYFDEAAWAAGAPAEGANQPVGSMVAEFTWPLAGAAPAPTQTLTFLSTNYSEAANPHLRRAILLDARYAASGYAWVSWYDYRRMGLDAWVAGLHQLVGAGGFSALRRSTGRQAGGVYDVTKSRVYWHDGGMNVLVSCLPNTIVANPSVVEASGFAPVDTDPALTSLVWDKKGGLLLGWSASGDGAQGDPGVSYPTPGGQYLLWMHAPYLSDRMPLADYSGMNVLDALKQIEAKGPFRMGYDGNAEFYFRVKANPVNPKATLTTMGVLDASVPTLPLADVDRDWGHDEILNYAEIVPSRVVLHPPTGRVRLLARPAAWARGQWKGSVAVHQIGTSNVSLVLRCVRGGVAGREDDGLVRMDKNGNECVYHSPGAGQRLHALRFAWLTYDRMIETETLVLATGGAGSKTIVVPLQPLLDAVADNAVAGIPHHGDQIDVARPTGDWHRSTIQSRTDDTALGRSTLVLQDDLPAGTYAIGTKVVIRTFLTNRWSNSRDGIATLNEVVSPPAAGGSRTWTVRTTRHLAVGMVVGLVDVEHTKRESEHLVTAVSNATTFTAVSLTGNTTDSYAAGSVFKGYVAPIENTVDQPRGKLFAVGTTGVHLLFEVPQSTASTRDEEPFLVGDEIDVTCPGLGLEPMRGSIVVAVDQKSINDHGKHPWTPVRASRFFTPPEAQEAVQAVIRDNAEPRYTLTLHGPWVLLPRFEDLYRVHDPETLPRVGSANPNGDVTPVSPDTNTAIAVIVRGYTLDPVTGALQVQAKAKHPHPW
jgi:hypothetical protein